MWGVGALSFEFLASWGMIGCFLGLVIWKHRRSSVEPRKFLQWLPLILFVVWSVAASSLAGRPPSSTGLARLADFLGIPIAFYGFTRLTQKSTRFVLKVWAAVFIVSCSLAGLQHFGVWPRSEFFSAYRWTHIGFERVYEEVTGSPHRFMAGGLAMHRLKFANTSGLGILFAFGLALEGSVSDLTSTDRKWSLITGTIGLVSLLMFPYVRAASIAAVASLILLLQLRFRRAGVGRMLVVLLLLLSALALTLDAGMRGRFIHAADSGSNGGRSALMASGLAAIKAHPWVGTGIGRFRPSLYAASAASQQVMEHPGKAHNQFISIAAEAGIPGLIFFLALLGWLARRFGRGGERGQAALCSLIFFTLIALFHDPLFHASFSMAFSLAMGAGLALTDNRNSSTLILKMSENQASPLNPQSGWMRDNFPSRGPDWDAAIDYGIDVALLLENLLLTPTQRLCRLQHTVDFHHALRNARKST